MSKRKRANSNKVVNEAEKKVQQKSHIEPLAGEDGKAIQEMIDLSNTYAGLWKQLDMHIFAAESLKKRIKDIQTGEIKMPLMVQISKTISYPEGDKEKVLKNMTNELRNVEIAKNGIEGQLQHRRDEYCESMLRVNRVLERKLGNKTHIESLTNARPKDAKTADDEVLIMEKELDKLTKEDEIQVKELIKKAAIENSKKQV